MKKLRLVWSLLFLLPVILQGHGLDGFRFVENRSQWDSRVLFKTEVPSGDLFLEKNGFTYNLRDEAALARIHLNKESGDYKNLMLKGHAFKMVLENSSTEAAITGKNRYPEYYNYFLGNDRSRWASHVNAFSLVSYQEIYEGIDLNIYSHDGRLKYDFIVLPGVSPAVIQLRYEGLDRMALNEGNLVLSTSVGAIVEKAPYAYQLIQGRKLEVPCRFKLTGNTVSFEFPRGYDPRTKLIIDPTLIFSTYSGSKSDNFGYTATYDSEGFLYSGSSSFGSRYPTTLGAYQRAFKGGSQFYAAGTDVAITKYDTTGTFRIYSTYLGGRQDELPHSLIVNSNDELLIFGTTGSDNFPLGPNAYDSTFAGGTDIMMFGIGIEYVNGCDIFVSRLSTDGSALLASTYLGGSENDGLLAIDNFSASPLRYNYADEVRGEIEVDSSDNVYLATCTHSDDFPATTGAFQTTHAGGNFDAVTVKLSPDLSKLVWSTFLGGAEDDAAYSLELDNSGNIYVAGGTSSANFPATPGTIFPSATGGVADGFISCLDQNGSNLLYSTYYGSSTYDQNYFVDLDKFGNVYVFGQTMAPGNTFIFNAAYSVPNSGQFISKLKPDLSAWVWSTVFGNGSGKPNISPTAFLVDLCSSVYLSGWGGTPENDQFLSLFGPSPPKQTFNDMPVSADAFQPTTSDELDFYLFVLKDDASAYSYASYFGGGQSPEHVDGGTSRFDRKGKIYQAMCAGCGGNSDMPVKPAYGNAWLPDSNNSECNCGVFKMDFALPAVVADFNAEKACVGQQVQFVNKSLEQSATKFQWLFGDGTSDTLKNPVHTYASGGTYNVTLIVTDNKTCNLGDTLTRQIYISALPLSVTATATVDEDSIYRHHSTVLHAFPQPGYLYSWTPAGSLNDPHIPNPVATPDTSTTYTVTISDPLNTNCSVSAAARVTVLEIVCDAPYIYVPDAFTPDGDGKNDVLYVRSRVIEEFFFTVYNRWGEKLFETNDMSTGWDGTYKGMKADPGVFVYYLEGKCIDGQKFFVKGNVTLIR